MFEGTQYQRQNGRRISNGCRSPSCECWSSRCSTCQQVSSPKSIPLHTRNSKDSSALDRNVQPLTIPGSMAPLRHWKAVAERRRHFRAGCLKQQLETGAATEQLARRTRATKRWRRAGLRRDDRERTLRFDHRRVIDTNIHTQPHQLFAPNSEVRQGSSRRHPRKLSPSQTHDPETTDAGRSVMFPMDRSNLVTRDESSGNAIAWRRSRLSISC
jgi:hypothetical protein